MKLFRAVFALLLILLAATAHALEIKPYSAAALAEAQNTYQSYALHFHADWCPVCRAQSMALERLKADKSLKVTVFVVHYDSEKNLRKQYRVHTQSTLIAFKGKTETGRLAGEKSDERISDVLASAL